MEEVFLKVGDVAEERYHMQFHEDDESNQDEVELGAEDPALNSMAFKDKC